MTEQKEHYDPYMARYRALLEKHGLTPPDLSDHIEKHKILYLTCRIIYAIEDTLSFLFGNIKLYFSLVSSYYQHSDVGSADDLHTSLQSIPDLIIILAIGIPVAVIQVLGTYFSDSKDLKTNKVKYFFAKILAPYLRDVLQGIKWAYKGMRTVLNTIFHFMPRHKELVLKILFPLSIAIAVVSLLNRIFLRTLRNFRKLRQSANRKVSLETLEEGHVLKFRDEMPTEAKDLAKLKKSLVYVQGAEDFELIYIDSDANSKPINLTLEKKYEIQQQIQDFQSQNICHRIEQEFIGIDNKNRRVNKLYFEERLPQTLDEHANSLIFLTDKSLENSKRLVYVNSNCGATDDERSEYFIKAVANEINYKSALILHSHQIEQILKTIDYKDGELGLSIEEWDARKEKKKENLPGSLIFFCYASVVLSALIDGSYFYIGVLFIASFNPAVFIAILAMAAVMIMVCLVGRIYEEYCYQKAFNVSQIEIDLNIQKTELNILSQEIEKLLLQDGAKDFARLNVLFQRFKQSLIAYDEQQRKLESNIRISASEAFLRGLRNGLSTQGVISALMFVGITIMFLTGTTCPPAFVIVMMSISFLALVRSVYRYMQSYYEYKKKDIPLQKLSVEEIQNVSVSTNDEVANIYQIFINKKRELDERIISKPPNLYEEENSEVVRLICSGFTKAQKNFGECTLGEPRDGEEWWLTLTSLIFSVSMAGVFGVRGVHKMYSGQDDNANTVENTTVKPTNTIRGPLKRVRSQENSFFIIHDDKFRASPTHGNLRPTSNNKV